MDTEDTRYVPSGVDYSLVAADIVTLQAAPPSLVISGGAAARFAWDEFLYGQLRNSHTRRAYRRAANRFLRWCEARGLLLHTIAPAHVGQYLDEEAYLMMTQETEFLKAQQQFRRLCELMRQAGREGWRMDEIERKAMPELMRLGLEFLMGHAESQGVGDVGPTVTSDERTLHRSEELHPRRYLSIFGEMWMARYVYVLREGQKAEYVPSDARLGLPAGENSYVLEEWQQRLCVKDAFGQSVEDLKAILGHGVSVRTAEGMNRNMAEYAEAYRLAQPVPPAEQEGELLVVTADGKGVVMRRPLAEELREETVAAAATVPVPVTELPCRQTRRTSSATRRARKARRRQAEEAVQKHHQRLPSAAVDADEAKNKRTGKKQMAYVGAVYTIDRFPRTSEDVLNEMARRTCDQERPRPQHKRVWAEMTRIIEGKPCSGREWLFCSLAVECNQRDQQRKKTLICLLDGERSLWDMQRFWFGRAVGILDIFHVSCRLDRTNCGWIAIFSRSFRLFRRLKRRAAGYHRR